MLFLNLKSILKARGIDRPTAFLHNAGLAYPAIKVLLYSENRSIRLDHIEKLCTALQCTPNDIFTWVAESHHQDVDNHPLAPIKRKDENISLQEALRKIPISQLKEAVTLIENMGKKRPTEE
ncbi:MAG: helix-turn-helix transcriptional regulator [Chitinophagaceae bacterium]|nr:helix-turn-helix transcriptional regulator [Chitinophagaceae bacterium]